jgi:hypothetical protein
MNTAIEARLGPIERVYRVRPGLRRARWLAAFACFSAAVLAWGFAGLRAFVALTEYGPLLVGRWVAGPALAGILLALLGSALGWRAWRTARLRVRLHAGGLAVVLGRRGRALPWSQILTIWSRAERTGIPGIQGSPRVRLEIEASDGQRVRLSEDLEDFESLAQAIKARVYPDLLAAYTRAFNDGQPIAFGPIHLTREGLRDGRRGALAWSLIAAARLESGRLKIEADRSGRRTTLSFPAHHIPNVELCAQLIEEIQQTA